MSLPRIEKTTLFAPWSLRLVSLAIQLLLATIVLHRFAALPTTVAINLMAVAFAAAGVAALGAIAALVQVWRHGSAGASAAAGALLLGSSLLILPAYYLPVVMRSGATYDVSTDVAQPPAYQALARVRLAAGINQAAMPSADATLEPIVSTRSPSDVFDLANDLIRQLDLNIVAEQAPGFGEDDGSIEATDRTFLLGLIDDVSIRISTRSGATRVDVRSAARYPRLDLGRNAERVQLIVHKLQASIDASVPSDPSLAADAASGSNSAVKQPGGTAGAATVLRRKKRALSQPSAPGAPVPTALQH